MKTTRIFALVLSLVLMLSMIFTLVSCGGTNTECTEHKDEHGDGICDTEGCGASVDATPDASADAFNENGELYLFKNGAPTFQFVVGQDAITQQMSSIVELAELLSGLCNKGTEIKTVGPMDQAQTVEILVGTVTNRGDEYNINKYDYGNTGYFVKQIGTKIVVNGGSDTALASAIKHLKENVFGIKKSNPNFTDFVIAADKQYENIQNNYAIKSITVAGNSVKDYVITYAANDKYSEKNATNLQSSLYIKCGVRLDVVAENKAEGKLKIAFRNIENTGKGNGFYVKVDENKNFVIECEYAGWSEKITTDYFNNNVFNKRNSLTFAADYSYSKNYRDIYYKDYAVGDGETDDFFKLKEVHDLANKYLLNVHADPNQTYKIGNKNGNQTITVKTNTYWHGCKFIFDDEEVAYDSEGRQVSIFTFARDASHTTYYNIADMPFTSLAAGQTSIDWAPGRTVMVVVYNKNVRHYIRSGSNADQTNDPTKLGQSQHELIIIDKDGKIDPSTPVQWEYTTITSMDIYDVDDREIEIRGEGENGALTTITTLYNEGPGAYWYYARNLYISRSNMVLSGIEHKIESFVPYAEGGNNSPYSGFTQVRNCNNVILENLIISNPEVYYDTDTEKRPIPQPNPTGANMGSYELDANLANNVLWRDITQSNFFEPDGTVVFKGNMGTNFCKNLTFDRVFNCSFDAHCGVYNGTIRNSTLEHINYIGAGTITLENVTVYVDGNLHSSINLRNDYGSTWNGDININGLTLKHNKDGISKTNTDGGGVRIINAAWNNHFYGYTTYLPQNITIRNLLTEQYSVAMVDGKRVETHISYNSFAVSLFARQINNATCDYYRDKTIGGNENKNPTVPTKRVELYTEYTGKYAELGITKNLVFNFPQKEHSGGSTMFKETVYMIDGVEV